MCMYHFTAVCVCFLFSVNGIWNSVSVWLFLIHDCWHSHYISIMLILLHHHCTYCYIISFDASYSIEITIFKSVSVCTTHHFSMHGAMWKRHQNVCKEKLYNKLIFRQCSKVFWGDKHSYWWLITHQVTKHGRWSLWCWESWCPL